MTQRLRWSLLAALIVVGLGVSFLGPWTPAELVVWGARWAGEPIVLVGLIALQAALFTFALPGSVMLWLIAPFHPTPVAVLALVCGSVAGAVGARAFAHYMGRDAADAGPRAARVVTLLRRHSDLATQIALRALPGFPHSVVNYAGGVLELPVGRFALAAAVGLSVKWGVYVAVIRGMTTAGDGVDLRWGVAGLVGLAAFLLLGRWARGRLLAARRG